MKATVKAKIKRHCISDKTGMVHLDNFGSKIKRELLFPVGLECDAEPAHWFGEVQVFRAFNSNGDMDYFDHSEIEIIETDTLFDAYPNAGYGSDRACFDSYMAKINSF